MYSFSLPLTFLAPSGSFMFTVVHSLFGQPLPHSWTERIFGFSLNYEPGLFFIYRLDDPAIMMFIHHTPNPLSAGFLFGLLHGLIRRLFSVHDREQIIHEYELFLAAHRFSVFVMVPGVQAARGQAPAASSNGPTPKPRDPNH